MTLRPFYPMGFTPDDNPPPAPPASTLELQARLAAAETVLMIVAGLARMDEDYAAQLEAIRNVCAYALTPKVEK